MKDNEYFTSVLEVTYIDVVTLIGVQIGVNTCYPLKKLIVGTLIGVRTGVYTH